MSRNNRNQNTAAVVVETPNTEVETETTAPVAKTYDVPALLSEFKTKSGVIRALHAEGLKVNEIHKILVAAGWKSDRSGEEIRYQHVRNVIKQPLKAKSSTPATVEQAAPATSEPVVSTS